MKKPRISPLFEIKDPSAVREPYVRLFDLHALDIAPTTFPSDKPKLHIWTTGYCAANELLREPRLFLRDPVPPGMPYREYLIRTKPSATEYDLL